MIKEYNGWVLQENDKHFDSGFIVYIKNKGQGVGIEKAYLIDKDLVLDRVVDRFIKQELDSYIDR